MTRAQGEYEFSLDLEFGRTLKLRRKLRIQVEEMKHQERQYEQQNPLRLRIFGGLFESRFDITQGTLEVEDESYQIPPQVNGVIQQGEIF